VNPLDEFYAELVAAIPEWVSQGLCGQADPEEWFPDKGRPPRLAMRICAACPVRAECREYGTGERYGIWGGTTERQRRDLRRQGGVAA
jgi:Transcription factor WhiB.